MWVTVCSPELLREDVFSENYTLPHRFFFFLPRHRSCWRKPSAISQGSKVPCPSGKPKRAELGTSALAALGSVPVSVQTRCPPQVILLYAEFGCLPCLGLPSQTAMAFGCSLGLIDKWRADSADGATFVTLVSQDVLAHAQPRKLMLPQ